MQAHQRALVGQSVEFETDWLGRNFDVKIDPLRESPHRVSGTIGVALDVTERLKLHEEINFARLVQEALPPAEHPHLEGFDIFGGSYPAANSHASASEIFKALWRAARKYSKGHGQQDDMTGIVVKVLDAGMGLKKCRGHHR